MNSNTEEIVLKFKNAKEVFEKLKIKLVKERTDLFKELRQVIVDDLDNIVSVICKETGKVKVEALASDMFPVLDTLNYFIKNLEKNLASKNIKSSSGDKCSVEYRPSGAALIISPWNFPMLLAFVPVLNAVAAGCSVILKPSEITPETGRYIEILFKKAGFPENSVQCIYGGAEAVQAAIRQKPARVLFTGSTKTGREIGKLCGELLIPAVLELGGKAPAIICGDIDIERVSNAVIYGAFMNNGQICVAMSRVLIDEKIKEKFTAALIEKAGKIVLDRDYGRLVQPERIPYLKILIDDAVGKGAKIIYKGEKSDEFLSPVIIDNVTPEMRIFREECFAPVTCLTAYKSEEEAIALANDCDYGLAASIWAKDLKKAEKISEYITAGSIGINEWIKGVAEPAIPFGGLKNSGYGRYHCDEGVQFFSDKISILKSKSKNTSEINWLPYEPEMYKDFKTAVLFLSGVKKIGPGVLKSLNKIKGRMKRR
ncbi:MAG: aldehyde dehydrogenase family protein [Endomicrobia bacterium]|nr:aldehyde dehydrogenase family protein [Endomicrobiia bacterium]